MIIVATYNIHRCIGGDGRYAPERVAQVLEEIDADVVALQEVSVRPAPGGIDQAGYLAEALGYSRTLGATLTADDGSVLANAILSRQPPTSVSEIRLVSYREPRAALVATLPGAEGAPWRLVATHLGLNAAERRRQRAQLATELAKDTETPTVVAGDFNTVRARRMWGGFGGAPAVRTFPARWPVLPLDRIWVRPTGLLDAAWAHRTAVARVASDHLPLVAYLGVARTVRRGGQVE